ncbi:predicted protein [Plenodomus lingam JN3]|uniref:Predicted protein n=1 Tax=Leptosphaeria maculans (strain JN3 / isolate v23.1.3 / race Av1-4-5-6-7-8) TaxID=985895 RepID=E4ZJV2_LEPMJ|nr:predicted protein [Plenodomus lingam JN3]CBX91387.1 predicted protein [Plenodomus lingam JN3]
MSIGRSKTIREAILPPPLCLKKKASFPSEQEQRSQTAGRYQHPGS